jgi:hypothetical protein
VALSSFGPFPVPAATGEAVLADIAALANAKASRD